MDEHITRHLLHAIHQGWRNPGDLAAIALAHLFEQCPACREEFEAWRRQVGEGVARPAGGDFDAALDRFFEEDGVEGDELVAESTRVEAQRRKARSRAEELLGLPAEEQLDWVRSESEGHAGPLLAEALIAESRRKAPGYPWEAITLANLARTVLQHSATTLFAAELYARALGHLANSLRVTGDLPRSEQILLDARYFLRSQGGGDRLVRAELDSLEGSLRMGQRRPREAIPRLLRAQMVYRMEEEVESAAAVLLKLNRAHRQVRELDHALSLLDEAERLLDSVSTPSANLLSSLTGGRIVTLCKKGDGAAAQAFVDDLIEVSEPGPVGRLRARWAHAEVLKSLRQTEAARDGFFDIGQAFADLGLQYDAALASLDAAALSAGLGLPSEAEQLASDALPVFERLGVQPKVAKARRLRDRANSGRFAG